MGIPECKKLVDCILWCLEEGRYTTAEAVEQLNKTIMQVYLYHIHGIDNQIKKRNRLYKYAFIRLNKLLTKIERRM